MWWNFLWIFGVRLSALRWLRMLAMEEGLRRHSDTRSVMLRRSLGCGVGVVTGCLATAEGVPCPVASRSEDEALLMTFRDACCRGDVIRGSSTSSFTSAVVVDGSVTMAAALPVPPLPPFISSNSASSAAALAFSCSSWWVYSLRRLLSLSSLSSGKKPVYGGYPIRRPPLYKGHLCEPQYCFPHSF